MLIDLGGFFRIYSENRTRWWSKQNIDATVTMASKTGHAVCFEELYGTGANEH